ncbi:MAG TPA: stage II sporulation protein M [Nitrososphaerales archaeon]|nr:stage II sporulation protein M [Nitrososphaerales archaeon]
MSESPPVLEAPAMPRSLASELLDRQRLLLVLGVFVVELVIFVSGLVTPLSSGEQQIIANQTSSQFAPIQSASLQEQVAFIFSHNLLIALAEMVPVFGAFLFVYSVHFTGLATQAIVAEKNLPGLAGLILFIFPYTFVELFAYAIAVASGVMLIWSTITKRLMRELKVFAIEVVVIVGVLFTAAAMEAATGSSWIIGIALWIPTGLAIVGLKILSSRKPR